MPAGLNSQAQQPGLVPSVKAHELRKGRRKLNKAIFEVDTAAALRTNAQKNHEKVGVNDRPVGDVTIYRNDIDTARFPVPMHQDFGEILSIENVPNVENRIEKQAQTRSNVSH